MTRLPLPLDIERWVLTSTDRLGLDHWQIRVVAHDGDIPGHDDADGRVEPVDGRWVATIHLAGHIWDDPTDARVTLAHELLHLAHRDATDVIRLTLPPLLADSTYTAVWETFRQAVELGVDRLAREVAALLELPPPRRPPSPPTGSRPADPGMWGAVEPS